jgi:hypothetical protein
MANPYDSEAVEPHATSKLSTARSSETQRGAQQFGVTDAVPAARRCADA